MDNQKSQKKKTGMSQKTPPRVLPMLCDVFGKALDIVEMLFADPGHLYTPFVIDEADDFNIFYILIQSFH